MKFFALFLTWLVLSWNLNAQEMVYPEDSLTTIPSLPRSAVNLPPGSATGPAARLTRAIYGIIRFPRTALATRTVGKVMVYGVVDKDGSFRVDSASLFREESSLDLGQDQPKVTTQDVPLGTVSNFVLKKKKWRIADAPKKWSLAQKDLVLEGVRVARSLPKFKPGTLDGAPVASYFTLPVVFQLGLRNW